LACLIIKNWKVQRWIFKCDDETSSRGTATFSTKNLFKQRASHNKDLGTVEELSVLLQQWVPAKCKLAIPTLYNSFEEYLQYILRKGAAIEAVFESKGKRVDS